MPFGPSTFVLQNYHQVGFDSKKKRKTVAAPGVPVQVSHTIATLSPRHLTQKWPDFSLLHSATLQLLDNVNSDQKSGVFLQISDQKGLSYRVGTLV